MGYTILVVTTMHFEGFLLCCIWSQETTQSTYDLSAMCE